MTSTDCLFCGIASGAVPAAVVHETEHTVAFRDVAPQAPTHVLVVPRSHYANAAELTAAAPDVLAEVLATAAAVVESEGLVDGHRLVLNTGPAAGQTVFHVHVHVLGGRRLTWPPG